MTQRETVYCPLLSIASNGVDMVCTEDRCAWYMANVKKCSMYIMGYNALMEANSKKKQQ